MRSLEDIGSQPLCHGEVPCALNTYFPCVCKDAINFRKETKGAMNQKRVRKTLYSKMYFYLAQIFFANYWFRF